MSPILLRTVLIIGAIIVVILQVASLIKYELVSASLLQGIDRLKARK